MREGRQLLACYHYESELTKYFKFGGGCGRPSSIFDGTGVRSLITGRDLLDFEDVMVVVNIYL